MSCAGPWRNCTPNPGDGPADGSGRPVSRLPGLDPVDPSGRHRRADRHGRPPHAVTGGLAVLAADDELRDGPGRPARSPLPLTRSPIPSALREGPRRGTRGRLCGELHSSLRPGVCTVGAAVRSRPRRSGRPHLSVMLPEFRLRAHRGRGSSGPDGSPRPIGRARRRQATPTPPAEHARVRRFRHGWPGGHAFPEVVSPCGTGLRAAERRAYFEVHVAATSNPGSTPGGCARQCHIGVASMAPDRSRLHAGTRNRFRILAGSCLVRVLARLRHEQHHARLVFWSDRPSFRRLRVTPGGCGLFHRIPQPLPSPVLVLPLSVSSDEGRHRWARKFTRTPVAARLPGVSLLAGIGIPDPRFAGLFTCRRSETRSAGP